MGNETSTPAGPESMTDEEYRVRSISKMDKEMRRKYAQGAKFNFKVVVRGDSSTGKSTLLRRLRGGTFVPDYVPTPEIKTAHIPWTARSSPEDTVMLEVWDVVDKASKRKVSDSLTLANANRDDAESGRHTFPLDATVVDVYQGCHAAVFLVDPSKKWTYEYVQRELALVPEHIPTCILINFRDYPASKRADSSRGGGGGLRVRVREATLPPVRRGDVPAQLLRPAGALHVFTHPVPVPETRQPGAGDATQHERHRAGAGGAQDGEGVQIRRVRAQNRGGDGGRGGRRGRLRDGERPVDRQSEHVGVPAGPREAAITWEKLSKTTLGEAPVLLGSAAVSGILSGVSAVAATTPADIAENVKSLASLKTLGLGPAEKKGTFVDEPRERVAPQFSHLAGRGGAAAAAFGGTEIDDDDEGSPAGERPGEHGGPGPRAGMRGGGEHPDVAAHVGDDSANFFRRRYPEGARRRRLGTLPRRRTVLERRRERRRWTARVFERRLRIRRRPRLRARLGRQRRRGRFGVGVEGGDCSLGRRRRERRRARGTTTRRATIPRVSPRRSAWCGRSARRIRSSARPRPRRPSRKTSR